MLASSMDTDSFPANESFSLHEGANDMVSQIVGGLNAPIPLTKLCDSFAGKPSDV